MDKSRGRGGLACSGSKLTATLALPCTLKFQKSHGFRLRHEQTFLKGCDHSILRVCTVGESDRLLTLLSALKNR